MGLIENNNNIIKPKNLINKIEKLYCKIINKINNNNFIKIPLYKDFILNNEFHDNSIEGKSNNWIFDINLINIKNKDFNFINSSFYCNLTDLI